MPNLHHTHKLCNLFADNAYFDLDHYYHQARMEEAAKQFNLLRSAMLDRVTADREGQEAARKEGQRHTPVALRFQWSEQLTSLFGLPPQDSAGQPEGTAMLWHLWTAFQGHKAAREFIERLRI